MEVCKCVKQQTHEGIAAIECMSIYLVICHDLSFFFLWMQLQPEGGRERGPEGGSSKVREYGKEHIHSQWIIPILSSSCMPSQYIYACQLY